MSWARLHASSEGVAQIQVSEYIKQKHPELVFIHIPNERDCTPQHGAILKKMGVLKGVSDIFMPKGNHTFKGLWIELKSKVGKPSTAQLDFLAKMIEEGYAAHVAYGSEECIKIIKNFYDLSE